MAKDKNTLTVVIVKYIPEFCGHIHTVYIDAQHCMDHLKEKYPDFNIMVALNEQAR